ncbi:MAG: cytochrome c3 family protein, partial [Bacillota bacterium]
MVRGTIGLLKGIIATGILLYGLFFLAQSAGAVLGEKDRTGDSALCEYCHGSAEKVLSHRKVNALKLQEISCLQCHEPHGAGQTPVPSPEKGSCISCHYEYSPASGFLAQGVSVHPPAAKLNCTDCHTMHEPGVKPGYQIPLGDLCVSCHVKQAQEENKKFRHKPFGDKQCTSCHNPHSSIYPKLLVFPEQSLCQTCHLDRIKLQSNPVKHPPFEKGYCSSCHNAHASDNDKQLILPLQQLCYTCHPDRNKELSKKYKHAPFQRGECTSCHSPHSSTGQKLVKAETISKLCYKCHSDLEAVMALTSKHPVDQKIQCTSCHSPHSSDNTQMKLGEGNNLCFFCHQDKEWTYKNIGHSKIVNGLGYGSCLNCHTPHGSANKPLMLQEEISLCTACHANKIGTMSTHPVGLNFIDPDKGTRMTCTTTCHNPHGSPFRFNTTKKGDGLCLTC